MTFLLSHLKPRAATASLAFMAASFALLLATISASGQTLDASRIGAFGTAAATGPSTSIDATPPALDFSSSLGSSSFLIGDVSDPVAGNLSLPEAPEPSISSANPDHPNVTASAVWHQVPFSRIGIGADISLLGIGIKGATVLDDFFDARLDLDFLNFNSSQFEIQGFDASVDLHLASASASLDWYPHNSVWRISPGLMLFNQNQLSVAAKIAPGTSFSLNSQQFYSASANAATGATPLMGSGVLGLHTNVPAFTIAGGFGRFVPHSNRHWSFPSEFGVAFTGAPTANVNTSGWVCLDSAQTQCSNIGDKSNPVAIQFNDALETSLTKWRRDLAKVQIYPIFSYSVVYSFNIR